jgi:hypothetical protein
MALSAVFAQAGLGLAAAPILAAAEPEVLLHRTVDEVLEAAYPLTPLAERSDRAERVLPILDKAFDFAALTRRAIGPGWRHFSKVERQRSSNDFLPNAIRTYDAIVADAFDPSIAAREAFLSYREAEGSP